MRHFNRNKWFQKGNKLQKSGVTPIRVSRIKTDEMIWMETEARSFWKEYFRYCDMLMSKNDTNTTNVTTQRGGGNSVKRKS